MTIAESLLNNNALASLSQQAGSRITSAIQKASARTGVDFAYLMEQAAAESSFDAGATAKTSSASGLYQFLDKTWMNMVKKHGYKYGMGNLADKIDKNGSVSDPQTRKDILALRNNPEKAAALAAEFASDNKRYLESHTNADIGATELYLAHFLGAGGAAGFLNAMDKNPLTAGADIFPKAALANRNVFYNPQSGEPRSLAEIYDFFDKKFSSSNGDTTIAATAHSNVNNAMLMAHQTSNDVRNTTFATLSNTMLRNPFISSTKSTGSATLKSLQPHGPVLNSALSSLSSALSFDAAALSILADQESDTHNNGSANRHALY